MKYSFIRLLIVLLSLVYYQNTFSCCCLILRNGIENLKNDNNYRFVTGKVERIKFINKSIFSKRKIVKVRLSVYESFGNKITKKKITIITPRNTGMCGYKFKRGEEYFLTLQRVKNSSKYYTSICLPNRGLNDADSLIQSFSD